MDATHFDRISRLLATHRYSRRRALTAGAGLVAAFSAGSVAAQAVMPTPLAASVEPHPKTFMFVQSFAAGSLVPKTGQAGVFTLTMRRGIDQTIYFSDRPERIVGMAPTAQFLEGLGFTPDNPPNAALVAHQGPSRQDIVVLELFSPHYDAATASITYDVKLLQATHSADFNFVQTPDATITSSRAYGASSLFIDDCPDETHCCVLGDKEIGDIEVGSCWSWTSLTCLTCDNNVGKYCNQKYPACKNQCNSVHYHCVNP